MSPTWLKLLLTLCLFGVTLLFGLAPYEASTSSRRGASLFRRRRIAAALTLLNCIGGGIFLGVAFLHLLPEVTEDVDEALDRLHLDAEMKEFPWAQFAVVSGLFLVLALEQFVAFCQERRERKRQEEGGGGGGGGGRGGGGGAEGETEGVGGLELNQERVPLLSKETEASSNKSIERKDALLDTNRSRDFTKVSHQSGDRKTKDKPETKRGDSPAETVDGDGAAEEVKRDIQTSSSSPASPTPDDDDDSHSTKTSKSLLRTFLLVFALSLHSLLEGLAFGLEGEVHNITKLFVAIISHKIVMAFTLGMSMTSVNRGLSTTTSSAPPPGLRRSIIGSIFIFAATSPIGAGIGIVLTSDSTNSESPSMQLVVGILQGLACGTFLYVTFFEILPREIESGQNYDLSREKSFEDDRLKLWNRHLRLTKVFAVMVGFVVMTIMMTFIGHGHSHHRNHTDHHHCCGAWL